jgi:hypothetical protein
MRIAEWRERVVLNIGASRRQALAALAGVGLATWQAPALGTKKTRKAVKRAKKKGDKKCRKQDGQCVQAMTDLCNAGIADPAEVAACITKFSACCAFLGDCQAASFLDCTFAA